jgi:tRNA threonylcarbamoyl adenosine modification protein YjeE
MEWTIASIEEESVYNLGRILADYVRPGVVFCLSGDLGSGKTTLARAIIRYTCNNVGEILSPTFNLVQSYEVGAGFEIWHLDLYRLNNIEEAIMLGLEEALIEHCCIIEWPGLIEPIMPAHSIYIQLDFQDRNSSSLSNQRMITIKTSNPIMASFNGLDE